MPRKKKQVDSSNEELTVQTITPSFQEEPSSKEGKETVLSATADLEKSRVLAKIKKKKNRIPDPEKLLDEITKDSGSFDEAKNVKEYAESAMRLADDETIELKVIKKFTADHEKRSRFKEFFLRKKKASSGPCVDLSKAPRYFPDLDQGLDESRVQERKNAGFTNAAKTSYTKSIGRIFFDNIFTFFNMMLTLIAVALLCVGSFTDLFFMVIAILNTGIGIFQEIRAKSTMDKLRLITAPTCMVVRGGQAVSIPCEEVVLDDIVLLSIGNQIASDGFVKKGAVEVNESLLTGESLPIKKKIGDQVYAGSYVVSGSAAIQVDKVGDANYSSSIQMMAKQYTKPKSELVRALNSIIHAVSLIIIPLGAILFTLNYLNSDVAEVFDRLKLSIEATAGSLIGMIPAGMYLLTSVALFTGVINISRRNTVVRELYCIEMLARANVLCLDKTGTLTDGTMNVEEVVVLDKSCDVKQVMGSYLASMEDNNQTSTALQQAFSYNTDLHVNSRISFSSDRKYSAVSFDKQGTYILGAPEFIYDYQDDPALSHLIADRQVKGYRVLMLAHTNAAIRNDNIHGVVAPVAIFVLIDHIRPDAPATIKWFNDNGVEIRIISGDNPLTASEIAKACKVPNAENWVSLDGLSISEVGEIADKYTVFGRVSPEQKAALIKALKNRQKVVAMTGDGVNDILAMKNSDCSIAMASGADAAKSVAHLVLTNSDFSSMPKVVEEGRRVINNIQRSSSLFLMKTFFTMILTIFVIISNIFGSKMMYPFAPKNLMIMEFFCIGCPSFFLAIQPNKNPIHGHFLRNVICRALPGTCLLLVSVALCMLLGNVGFFDLSDKLSSAQIDSSLRTMSVIAMVICGLAMLYQISKPLDIYRTVLVISMCLLSVLALFILPAEFIGIDYRELNKVQWIMISTIAFASLPLASGFNSLFGRLRTDVDLV